MADGMWRITRLAGTKAWYGSHGTPAPNYVVDEIRVWRDPETGSMVPSVEEEAHALVMEWPDGKQDFYPWCSILKAEYTPPTKDQS